MKKYLLLLTSMMILMTGCADPPRGGNDATLANSNAWKISSLMLDGKLIPTPPTANPIIRFEARRLFASSGCNSSQATYTAKKGTLSIQGDGVTEMGCDYLDYEDAFFTVLHAAIKYEVTADTLKLSDGTTNRVATFTTLAPQE
jgi:heat shock protein HslJ